MSKWSADFQLTRSKVIVVPDVKNFHSHDQPRAVAISTTSGSDLPTGG